MKIGCRSAAAEHEIGLFIYGVCIAHYAAALGRVIHSIT
jgi:hypothetical protein